MLAHGEAPPGRLHYDGADRETDWPDDLSEVVYIDYCCNALTGLLAQRKDSSGGSDILG